MGYYLLFIILLAPQIAFAQLGRPSKVTGPGYYASLNSPTISNKGELSFNPGTDELLFTSTAASEKRVLLPQELASFRIGQRTFISINNINTTSKRYPLPEHLFAEQLDSGQVVLCHYDLQGVVTGIDGRYGYRSLDSFFLIRRASDLAYSVITGNMMSSRKAVREPLLPYFADRPDLIKLLQSNTPNDLLINNLSNIIRSLNTGQSYALPLSHYDRMKQAAEAKRAQKASLHSNSER